MRVGIDFGTTRTVIAAPLDGRYPVVNFDTGENFKGWLPSIAALRGKELKFGWSAFDAICEEAAGAIRSIKRLVSTRTPDDALRDVGLSQISALELMTGYLKYVRRALTEQSNLDIDPDAIIEAMVAVPANASTPQRYITAEAFRLAGFEVLGVISEPTAAAIEYAHAALASASAKMPQRYLVVYDLGGGTFDTAAVSLKDRRFELLSNEGIARLGGDDFDDIILDLALEHVSIARESLTAPERGALLERCREAKETLTQNNRRMALDFAPHLSFSEPIVLETARIYARCEPLIKRTVELVERIMAGVKRFGIDPENPRELSAIYLVGGAVAFPPVARMLKERYKRKLKLALEPYAATAIGLAVAADKQSEVFVREAVTRYFGVWRESQAGREKIFDCIFSKESLPVGHQPIVVQRVYRPVHRVGHLRFLECSALGQQHDQPQGDMTPWRDIWFPYDPELANQEQIANLDKERKPGLENEEIVETYTYAPDGTVTVYIENRTRGYGRSYVLGTME